jgi:hypothetical protein
MFGNTKKTTQSENIVPGMQIVTIPNEFFGGADPSVRFKNTEKVVDLNKMAGTVAPNEREKRVLDQAMAKGSRLTGTKVWIIGGIILFVLAIAGASLYYWWSGRKPAPKPVVTTIPVVVTTHPATTTAVIPEPTGTAPTTTVTTTPEEPIIIKEPGLELPSKLTIESADIDGDGVSDAAEEVFGSDPGNPDTDSDSYNDGHELYYLYNPNGIEPMKVIDSGTVKLFRSGNFNYELYYPANWISAAVDNEGRLTLFTTLTGENVEVRVFDLKDGQTLADWFATVVSSDNTLADFVDVDSRFGAVGKARSDRLVYLYVSGQRVYALVYHEAEENLVFYKKVLEVMARSFKINTTTPAISSLPSSMSEFIISTTTETVETTTPTAEEVTGEEPEAEPESEEDVI